MNSSGIALVEDGGGPIFPRSGRACHSADWHASADRDVENWRGDPERTTRKQDPIGYWGVVVATMLMAIVSLGVGVGVFLGLVPLHHR